MTNDTLYNFESDLLAELRSIDQSAAHARAHRRHAARVIVPWAALGGALATASLSGPPAEQQSPEDGEPLRHPRFSPLPREVRRRSGRFA